MRQRPTAPEGLAPPRWVREAVRESSRTGRVLDHGFSDAQLKSVWWTSRLTEAGLADGTSPMITFPSTREDGTAVLTRADLFAMSADLRSKGRRGRDEQWLQFLWHVLAWGSGPSRRNNRARIDAFADPVTRRDRIGYLREAAERVWKEDVRGAYGALVEPGRGRIPGLGPAFFTKVLYFLGGDAPQERRAVRCLILDARVATSLRSCGWESLPKGNYNWFTDTYVSYCGLLSRWADDLSVAVGRTVEADEIERALFAGPT
ncbi:hypothetical protein ACFWFR_11695 [Oerskovia sp. NPDC060287]